MSSSSDWELPVSVRPKPEDYSFDLERALGAIVGIRAMVPGDAFTAETLGTERTGNGVLIRDGVVLTIGYLITEAETIWLHLIDGRAVPATVLAYDQETGFGLVQALAQLEMPGLPLGHSKAAKVGDPVVVAGAGGRKHSVAARIAAKQEFAGNWEYVLDEAFFTAPGASVLGRHGDDRRRRRTPRHRLAAGPAGARDRHARAAQHDRADRPPEADPRRPAHAWGGPTIRRVPGSASTPPRSTTRSWSRASPPAARRGGPICGPATSCWRWPTTRSAISPAFSAGSGRWARPGVEVPLTIFRDGRTFEVSVTSGDRNRFLKGPSLH